jgi:hypothetical protein
MAARRVAH